MNDEIQKIHTAAESGPAAMPAVLLRRLPALTQRLRARALQTPVRRLKLAKAVQVPVRRLTPARAVQVPVRRLTPARR